MLRQFGKFLPILVLLITGGCATTPTGPSVMVLPAPGKPFEVFQAEDATCRRWAEQLLGPSPQAVAGQSTVAGTLIGAAAGAAIGAATGNAGAGAAIGAGSGLLLGASSGTNQSQVYGYEAQRRYDNSYLQCMYSYGNQIPGTVRSNSNTRRVVRTPAPMPPPPPIGYQDDDDD